MAPPAPRGGRERRLLEDLFAPLDQERSREWAAALIARFGGLEAVFAASEQALNRAAGDRRAAALVAAAQSVRLGLLRWRLDGRPILSSADAVAHYLTATLAHQPMEQVHVLFLNAANRLLGDERMGSGSVVAAGLNPRIILGRALELGATALILCHNHPSGNPAPSGADAAATRRFAAAAAALDIELHDHLVVAAGGWSSMRAMGLL